MTVEVAAGSELDGSVAERVMGWTVEHFAGFDQWRDQDGWIYGSLARPYSTDITAAHDVIRKLNADGYGVSVDYEPGGGASISVLEVTADDCWKSFVILRAETAPLAICRAALKVVTGEPCHA